MDAFEGEGFFVQDWQFANACEFPRGDVGKVFVITLSFTIIKLVFQSEVSTTGFFTCQGIVAKEFAELGVAGQAPCFFKFHVHAFCAARDFDVVPEFIADSWDAGDGVHEAFLGAAHADVVPHELSEFTVNFIWCAGAFNVHHLLDACLDGFFCFLKFWCCGCDATRCDGGEVGWKGGGDDEVAIAETLHEGGCTQAVCTVVGEVGFTKDVQTRYGGHEVVVNPETTHGVVACRVNHHGFFVWVNVGDFFVHFEEVAVLAVNPFFAHAFDAVLEVEEDTKSCLGDAALVITGFLSSTGGDVTWGQVTEGWVLAFEVVVAVTVGYFGGFHFALANLFGYFAALGYPDAAVVTKGFGHEGELALVVALDWNAGRVNLGEAWVSEVGTFLPASVCGTNVAAHGVCGEEEAAAVTTSCYEDGVAREALDFACDHVTYDDALSVAVNDDEVKHFGAGVHFDVTLADFFFHGLVGTEEELLTSLTAAVEGTLKLGTTEGAVVEQTAVFTSEWYALGDALVDDVAGYFGQAVDVAFAGTEVTTLDGVVEEAVVGVTIVLVVVGGVDATLSCDGVGATWAILVAEALDVVAKFCKCCSGSTTSKTRTYDEYGVLTTVVGVDELGVGLVLGPLLFDRTFRDACTWHVVAYWKLNVVHSV